MSTIDQERAADCIDGIVEAVFTDDTITAVDFDEGDAAAIAIDLKDGRRRAVVVIYPEEGDAIVHAVGDASVLAAAEQLQSILVAGGERAFTALVIQLLGDDVAVGFAHDDDHEGGWPLANASDAVLIEALRPQADDADDVEEEG